MPGDLGVELRRAVDLLWDLDHPLHLIKISKKSQRMANS